MKKIAVYTIALNEAKHAAQWAEATKRFDYRLVFDTGSTDDTIGILESHGVDVWTIDVKPFRFDMARNAALALLPRDADLCLSLDMDEHPEARLYDKLQTIKNADKVRIWHNTNGNRWRCDRVHSRWGWHWVSPCHEVTQWYGGGEPRIVDLDADIFHLPDESKPRSGYLPLLELAVRERPSDGRMWTYLAREYFFRGDTDSLLSVAEDAVERNPWWPERAAVCVWAGRLSGDGEWFERAAQINPLEAEPWHELANYHYQSQNWDAVWDACIAGINCKPTTHYLRDESVLQWRLFDLLAVAQWNRGKYSDALHWGLKALAGNPDDERLQKNVEFFRGKVDETSERNPS